MNEEDILCTPKNEYKVKIKHLINKAAFKHLMTVKETHSKLNDITYSELKVQPYLTLDLLNNGQKELLYKLRSKCHESKLNFYKMHKNNLKCVFGCSKNGDQENEFLYCWPNVSQIKNHHMTNTTTCLATCKSKYIQYKYSARYKK